MKILEITVQRRIDNRTPVVVEYRQSGELPVRAEGRLELAAETLQAQVTPLDYGCELGRALFRDEVRDAFARALAQAGERLHVLLFVEDETLAAWRWERLAAPSDGAWDFLSLNQRTPFSLYLPSVADRRFPPIGRRDLRALIVAASPPDLGKRFGLETFDVAKAVAGVRAGLGDIAHTVLADTTAVPDAAGPPTLDALAQHITAAPTTLLHIICHGAVTDEGETLIYLADGENRTAAISASQLVERLRRLQGARGLPHLAFLSTCESAAPAAEAALGGLGQRLVRDLGMPAVVAMTQKVSIATADALAAAFYPRLWEHGQPDRALVEAGAALAARHDITVPALYSRLGGLPLFSDASGRELTNSEIEYGLQRLASLLPERAPVLLDDFTRQAALLRSGLSTSVAGLSGAAFEERDAALAAVGALCQEATDVSFAALAQGDQAPAYDGRCPFPGLAAFSLGDRKFFFGRETLVAQLADRLLAHPFLALSGPSGSGKSSLLFAGLIPALQQREPGLAVAAMRPGSDPMEQMEAALASLQGPATLLVVDQFEELFTLTETAEQRQAFVSRLLEEMRTRRVVLTLRGDFVDDCAAFPALYSALQSGLHLVSPMAQPELRSAMEQQAGVVGLRFEADLANTILDAVAGEPGAMPLMQHLLRRLWERRHGRWLRAAEYRRLGGVTQALAGSAEAVYASLSEAGQRQMRNVFLRLVRLDESNERRDTRRRVAVEDLAGVEADRAAVVRLVNRLADEKLLVSGANPVSGREEIELAHEALIHEWPRLQAWIADDRSGNLLHQQLSQAAELWQRSGQDRSYLYRDSRLRSAEAWIPLHNGMLNEREEEFLCASRAAMRNSQLRRALMLTTLILLPAVVAVIVMSIFRVGPFGEPEIEWTTAGVPAKEGVVWIDQISDGTLLAALHSQLGEPAQVARSEDGGQTWTTHNLQSQSDTVTQVLWSDTGGGIAYASVQAGNIFRSMDRGQTWAPLLKAPPVEGELYSIASSGDGVLFAADTEGGVYQLISERVDWELLRDCPQTGVHFLGWEGSALLIGTYHDGLWQWRESDGCRELVPETYGGVFAALPVGSTLHFVGQAGVHRVPDSGAPQLMTTEPMVALAALAGDDPAFLAAMDRIIWWRAGDEAVREFSRIEGAYVQQMFNDRQESDRLWAATSQGLFFSDVSVWRDYHD